MLSKQEMTRCHQSTVTALAVTHAKMKHSRCPIINSILIAVSVLLFISNNACSSCSQWNSISWPVQCVFTTHHSPDDCLDRLLPLKQCWGWIVTAYQVFNCSTRLHFKSEFHMVLNHIFRRQIHLNITGECSLAQPQMPQWRWSMSCSALPPAWMLLRQRHVCMRVLEVLEERSSLCTH